MNPHNAAVLSAVSAMLMVSSVSALPLPGGTLDPLGIPKYVTPLVIPPVLFDDGGAAMEIAVSLRQLSQQVLPTTGCTAASAAQVAAGGPAIACVGEAFPRTTLWGYGDPTRVGTFNNPGFTVEVTKDIQTTVRWINELVDANGNYLPHIIKDANGDPVIDQTLHWAAPNMDCREGNTRSDCRGASDQPYFGPVPMVSHVHGAHVGPGSDGYPEAWWLPKASNIDCVGIGTDRPDVPNYACNGTFFESAEGADTANALGQGYSIDLYSNDQPTTTLWYHDHALGITRVNVYAAGAGFWLIRDANDGETGLVSGVLPGPAPKVGQDPNGNAAIRQGIREIPIAIQPKSFNAEGSQFYPADRAFFEGLGTGQLFAGNVGVNIPFLPQATSDISPVWNPEAFFNTMVVNGNTWPVLAVAPERYRFRLVNAADSQFLNLSLQIVKKFATGTEQVLGELPFYQIGAEQGLLPRVVRLETGFATPLPGDGRDACSLAYLRQVETPPPALGSRLRAQLERTCVLLQRGTFAQQALLLGPAERADVIVDFTGLPQRFGSTGLVVRVINTAPDAPFGGFPDVPADPATTGQVMEFAIDSALANPTGDPSTPPASLLLDANPGGVPKLVVPSAVTRDLALLEEASALICVTIDAVTEAINLDPNSVPPTCDPVLGSVPFAPTAAVLGVNGSAGGTVQFWDDPIAQNPALGSVETWELWNGTVDAHPIHLHLVKFEVVNRQVIGGLVRPPEPWETGWKDTVIAYPGEVTRIKALFDIPGLYVWHCHILSHEDNEMMVPYCVGTPGVDCPAELFL